MTTYVIEQHIGYITDSKGSSRWWKPLESFEDQTLAKKELDLLSKIPYCTYRLITTETK